MVPADASAAPAAPLPTHQPAPLPTRVPVAAPPRVDAWLRAAPDGELTVLHRGPHAIYVALGDRCVGVVSGSAAAVPCALRTAGADLERTAGLVGEAAWVDAGVLHVDGRSLAVGRLVDVRVPRLGLPVRPRSDPAPDDVDALVADLGRGPGLTPEADDELCGWLAVHRAAGVETPALDLAVAHASARTTLLSATLLDCAVHGEVVPEFAAYVAALGAPAAPRRSEALLRLGHTSGAALLRGAHAALDALGVDLEQAA